MAAQALTPTLALIGGMQWFTPSQHRQEGQGGRGGARANAARDCGLGPIVQRLGLGVDTL